MKPSLLQVDSIHFLRIFVEAQANPCADAETSVTDSVEFTQDPVAPDQWHIELTLDIMAISEEKRPYYTGVIKLAGVFHVAGELPPGASTNLVRVNGCSILYSAAREMFANLTARGPHSMQLLPSRTFIDMKLDSAEEEDNLNKGGQQANN